jgi:hypothetical protein
MRPPPRQGKASPGEIPMRRSPFGLHPNGPYPTQGPQSGEVVRQTSGVVDMRGSGGWRSVFTVDCGELQWGQVVVTGEAIAAGAATDVAAYVDGPNDAPVSHPAVPGAIELWPWIEVRIAAWVNGQTYTMLEAAVGSHDGATAGGAQKTAGPVVLSFAVGEVPDKIEVFARARKGGLTETSVTTAEKLTLIAVSRFHR